jgi:splicing factor 3B subunit 1
LFSFSLDTAPKHLLNEFADEDAEDPFTHTAKQKQVATRESEYQLRRFSRDVGDVQKDAFQEGEGGEGESYKDAMRRRNLEKEEERVRRAIEKKAQDDIATGGAEAAAAPDATPRKRRWDVMTDEKSPIRDVTNKEWGDKEMQVKKKRSRWDETPVAGGIEETPRKASRWDQTPVGGVTPVMPGLPQGAVQPPAVLDRRNRYLSDEELDEMLPSEGYEIVTPPPGYQPIRTPARKLTTAPTPVGGGGFVMQDDAAAAQMAAMAGPELPTEIEGVGALAFFKQEDAAYFSKILGKQDEEGLTMEELKERKIMRLLLKIKNGTPPMRKSALRQITDNARQFGAGALFDKILPLLMERSLEDQERHLLVKVIDRVLYKLDDLVRPYVHKILVVIEPLLIDEDYYARVEGREIISNLSKAAGLAHMISTMRPDIDHADEYVRNTTARAFSVVASALGIPSLLPFLKAVCRSKKSWQARHTGIKIVQQIAIMMGCAVLPHLKSLVESVAHGLEDEQQKVRTMTALAIAALAEAAAPYGIESFDSVLKPLWTGIRKHRGKGLAAFLKAIGFIIPLMDPEYANYYTKEVMVILIREFQSPDEEMKKIVLKVVKQCASTDGVQPAYVKQEILPEFFKSFWVRRYACPLFYLECLFCLLDMLVVEWLWIVAITAKWSKRPLSSHKRPASRR